MKVTVTHLKAAWPEGTKVGDVVSLDGDTIPAWAVGKCKPAEPDAGQVEAPAERVTAPAKSKR